MTTTDPNTVRDPAQLGARIRAARKTQGLTLSQAAGLCGVGVRFLSELENGKPTAELGKALHVMRGLGLVLRVGTLGGQ